VNLLLVQPGERDSDELVIRGARAAHIRDVIGATVGQRLRIGLPREAIGTAAVLQIDDQHVRLGELEVEPIAAGPAIHLILAVPRPKVLHRMLETAACFGVSHIDLVNAWRVDKSYFSSPKLTESAIEQQLWLGTEQGRHAWLPTFSLHRMFVPFIRDFDSQGRHCLLAQPASGSWMNDRSSLSSQTVIAIGPEGGWIDKELGSFERAGFVAISLSESILRSEVALASALAQWELVRRAG